MAGGVDAVEFEELLHHCTAVLSCASVNLNL